MGVYPESFMRPIRNDVGRLLVRLEPVKPKGDSLPTPGKPKDSEQLRVIDVGAH